MCTLQRRCCSLLRCLPAVGGTAPRVARSGGGQEIGHALQHQPYIVCCVLIEVAVIGGIADPSPCIDLGLHKVVVLASFCKFAVESVKTVGLHKRDGCPHRDLAKTVFKHGPGKRGCRIFVTLVEQIFRYLEKITEYFRFD